jgi:hypothetical protein
MQNQHIKNRAKKLENAYAVADADRKNLYRAALHWRNTSIQQYEETKLLTGVVSLGFALLSSCMFYIIALKELSK